ncbi:MAG TPA: SemiSWEET transporter [Ferruginibacter sp.]|nr:SemiSWEET transporter [Ferruginibacter sp.]HPH90502.1 SemiSWEET transporter [Ferruginibacter sp.]
MNSSSIETLVGIVASIGTAMSMVPQLTKLIKEKEAENISMNMLLVLFLGVGCWIVYGVLKKDWIIIISNTFSLVINVLLTVLAIKYKKK